MCVFVRPRREERERTNGSSAKFDTRISKGSGIGLIWRKDVVKTGSDLGCGLEK